ncbi:MAG: hypothetical protein KBC69_00485 [Candidatus Magasanikbacteria bacterium]|nr:hypothetical protein [Candidatus Magasanikbacteria bacterium]
MELSPHLEGMVDRMVAKFSKEVAKEKDLAIILLKGHLLIEYYLNHVILYWDDKARVDGKSFFEKVNLIESKKIFQDNTTVSLHALNKVRNDLSHKLDFSISESEIDRIGFHLGKIYIVEKFKNNPENENYLQRLLMLVLIKLLTKVCLPLFVKMEEEKSVFKDKNETIDNQALMKE